MQLSRIIIIIPQIREVYADIDHYADKMAESEQLSFESQETSFESSMSQSRVLTELSPVSANEVADISPSTPVKGWVNEHFALRIVNGKALRICLAKNCMKQYAPASSTNVFKNHWKKEHSTKVSLKKTNFIFHDQLHINRLVKAVIALHWDYADIEKVEFRKLCESFCPTKRVITRKTLSSIITRKREELTEMVTEKLQNAPSVALTFDLWSARKGGRGFGCITAHYINSDGQLVNFILAFERMIFPHDAEAIYEFLARVIKDHKLEKKVLAITTDNASNNIKAMQMLKEKVELSPFTVESLSFIHYKCVAHIIDLGIRAAINDLQRTLKPVRDFVLSIRSSSNRRETFNGIQQELIEDGLLQTNAPLELVEDVEHRWGSTYLMLKRAFVLRHAVDQMMDQTATMRSLDPIDWSIIEELLTFLRKFHSATTKLCIGTDVSVSVVSRKVPGLIDHCVKFEENCNSAISQAAKSLRDKLTKYELEMYHPVVNMAYVLDPRFKTRKMSVELAEAVQAQLTSLIEQIPAPIRNNRTEDSSSDESEPELSSSELDMYLNSRPLKNTVAVDWWRANAEQYPRLYEIARKILPVQATSVASERVFSVAGEVECKSRNKLSDESVEAIVLFKSWMQFLNIE